MAQKVASIYAVMGLDLGPFNQNMRQARTGLSNLTGNMQNVERQSRNMTSGLKNFVGGVIQTATGFLTARVFERLGQQIASVAKSAISATADFQAMQVGLEGLLAREMARGELVERTSYAVAGLSEKEIKRLSTLRDKYDDVAQRVAILNQRLDEQRSRPKTAASTIMGTEDQLRKAQRDLQDITTEMAVLEAATGRVVAVTSKVYEGERAISDIMPEAQKRAKLLMEELADVAIASPYEVAAIQQTFKMAMAFGYTADQAKVFTGAILNMAAGIGADNNMLQRMSYNLTQVRLANEITARDIRELALAGFDLGGVLAYLGKKFDLSISDYESFNAALDAGKITWEQFTEGFAEYADKNFGGASERMSRTLKGLQSTFKDVFLLTMPRILGPAAEHVTDRLNKMLDLFLAIRKTPILDNIGSAWAASVDRSLGSFDDLLDRVDQYVGLQERLGGLGGPGTVGQVSQIEATRKEMEKLTHGLGLLGIALDVAFGPEKAGQIAGTIKTIQESIGKLREGDIAGALATLKVPQNIIDGYQKVEDFVTGIAGKVAAAAKLLRGQDIWEHEDGRWRQRTTGYKDALAVLGMPPNLLEDIGKVESFLDGIGERIRGAIDNLRGGEQWAYRDGHWRKEGMGWKAFLAELDIPPGTLSLLTELETSLGNMAASGTALARELPGLAPVLGAFATGSLATFARLADESAADTASILVSLRELTSFLSSQGQSAWASFNKNALEPARNAMGSIAKLLGGEEGSILSGANAVASTFEKILKPTLLDVKDAVLYPMFQDLKLIASVLRSIVDMINMLKGIKPMGDMAFPNAGGDVSRFATGTPFSVGGWAKVGELGPELVRLPRGSAVYSAHDSAKMGGGITFGPGSVVVNVPAGADGKRIGDELGRALVRQLRAAGSVA